MENAALYTLVGSVITNSIQLGSTLTVGKGGAVTATNVEVSLYGGGSLSVVNAGSVIATNALIVGDDIQAAYGGVGTLSVSGAGSSVKIGSMYDTVAGLASGNQGLYVGEGNKGLLNISKGGTVLVAGADNVWIGYIGGQGTAVVTDAGSVFTTGGT